MNVELDRARIEEILDAVVQQLEGDFLLIGGALVSLWLSPRRVTEDIDLIGLSGTSNERLRLMELAEQLGLPVEALNSAADFFVFRIPDWRNQIDIFMSGPRTRIHRPTPTLFLLLKIGRLSQQDLDDCTALLDRARAEGWALDRNRVLSAIDGLVAAETETVERRRILRDALASMEE